MKKNSGLSKVLLICSSALATPSLIIWGLWIVTLSSNDGKTQKVVADVYFNYFPDFLLGQSVEQSIISLSACGILTASFGLFLSICSLSISKKYRAFFWIVIVLNSLAVLLNALQILNIVQRM